MKGELRELYQEVIVDHSRRPRNHRPIADATHRGEGYNPLCGDRATIFLTVQDGVIKDAAFEGSGCSISTASASMMTEALKGRTVDEAEALFQRFHGMVTGPSDEAGQHGSLAELGKLAVFSGVCEFPARVKCASLPWHTFEAALRGGGTAQTE
jgi:nitrogen fixation NifU-like protein